MALVKAAQQEYDKLAPHYERRWRSYIDSTMQIVFHGLEFDGAERVLDIPCGTGELGRRLMNQWPGLTLVGTDLSTRMLEQAREKQLSGVQWSQAAVEQLPFADEVFDCVICANSFHYFHQPQRALAEMNRVLRPGGRLILVDWCDDYLSCKLCSLWLRWFDPAFQRTYSSRRCRALLKAAAFEVTAAERFRVQWIWGLMRMSCRK